MLLFFLPATTIRISYLSSRGSKKNVLSQNDYQDIPHFVALLNPSHQCQDGQRPEEGDVLSDAWSTDEERMLC